jgi:hypothetical protein
VRKAPISTLPEEIVRLGSIYWVHKGVNKMDMHVLVW